MPGAQTLREKALYIQIDMQIGCSCQSMPLHMLRGSHTQGFSDTTHSNVQEWVGWRKGWCVGDGVCRLTVFACCVSAGETTGVNKVRLQLLQTTASGTSSMPTRLMVKEAGNGLAQTTHTHTRIHYRIHRAVHSDRQSRN